MLSNVWNSFINFALFVENLEQDNVGYFKVYLCMLVWFIVFYFFFNKTRCFLRKKVKNTTVRFSFSCLICIIIGYLLSYNLSGLKTMYEENYIIERILKRYTECFLWKKNTFFYRLLLIEWLMSECCNNE